MTARYYLSATDGKITVYRTSLRPYASALFNSAINGTGKAHLVGELRFATGRPEGSHQTLRISRQQFLLLCEKKRERIEAAGRDPKYYSTPQESWVRNTDLKG